MDFGRLYRKYGGSLDWSNSNNHTNRVALGDVVEARFESTLNWTHVCIFKVHGLINGDERIMLSKRDSGSSTWQMIHRVTKANAAQPNTIETLHGLGTSFGTAIRLANNFIAADTWYCTAASCDGDAFFLDGYDLKSGAYSSGTVGHINQDANDLTGATDLGNAAAYPGDEFRGCMAFSAYFHWKFQKHDTVAFARDPYSFFEQCHGRCAWFLPLDGRKISAGEIIDLSGKGNHGTLTLDGTNPFTRVEGAPIWARGRLLHLEELAVNVVAGAVVLEGSLGVDIDLDSDLTATRAIAGSLGADIELDSELGIGVALAGSLGADIDLDSDLILGVELAGSMGVDIDLDSDLILGVELAGSMGVDIDLDSDLAISVALAGSMGVDIEMDSDLTIGGQIVLEGSLGVDIDLDSDLTIGVALAGSLGTDIELDSDLTIGGQVTLEGSLGADIELDSDLTAIRAIAGSLGVDIELDSELQERKFLAGVLGIDIELDSDLTFQTAELAGSMGVDIDMSSTLTGTKALAGSLGIDVELDSNLTITGLFKSGVLDIWNVQTRPSRWGVTTRPSRWNVTA